MSREPSGDTRIPRRRLLQGGLAVAAGAGLLAFRSLADRLAAMAPRSKRVVIPADFPEDVVFVDEVIVCRTTAGVRAFSARCPHLGCVITRQVDGLIACPCHGSRFRSDGSVAAGPAVRGLEPLPHGIDPTTGAIVVRA